VSSPLAWSTLTSSPPYDVEAPFEALPSSFLFTSASLVFLEELKAVYVVSLVKKDASAFCWVPIILVITPLLL